MNSRPILTHARPTREILVGMLANLQKFRANHKPQTRFDRGIDELLEEGAAILDEAREQCQAELDELDALDGPTLEEERELKRQAAQEAAI